MSSTTEHNSNQFLTVQYVTSQKGLTTEQFTEQILRIIKDSNRKIVLSLVPIKDDIILDGTVFFPDAQNVAMVYFDSEYERLILKDFDSSEITFKKYKEERNLLIAAIKAQPKESKRNIQATASCSYKSRLLSNIPGITDKDQNLI